MRQEPEQFSELALQDWQFTVTTLGSIDEVVHSLLVPNEVVSRTTDFGTEKRPASSYYFDNEL